MRYGRCLLAGVELLSPVTAESMAQAQGPFQVVPWSFEYYRVHADITPDLPGIDALLKKAGPSKADLAEAGSLHRRFPAMAVLDWRFDALYRPIVCVGTLAPSIVGNCPLL